MTPTMTAKNRPLTKKSEFLVALFCETVEDEDTSPIHDDPETSQVETSVYCETYCEAEVARRRVHERG